jgi:hypothetical protein
MTPLELAVLFLRIAARVLLMRRSLSEEDLRRLTIADFLPKETFDDIVARKKREKEGQ